MPEIRTLAICGLRRGSRILVAQGFDSARGEGFLRPLGGTVEFGERAADAIRREVREELRAEITDPVQLGVLENVFTYEGQPGHEIVFVFDAQFSDPRLNQKDSLPIHEEGIWDGPARWVDVDGGLPFDLFPDGLATLLEKTSPANGEPDGQNPIGPTA